jgi:cell division protein FtsQ
MARKNGPPSDDQEFSSRYGSTRSEVDFYPGREFDDGETIDPARLIDDESDQESPFLRAQKRVPVRRGPLPKKTANRLKIVLLAALVVGAVCGVLFAAYHYATNSWRFRIESSDSIQVSGNENVTRDEVVAVFADEGDISRNVFRISLDERKQKLEQIPWVESATVMRYLPNRLAVVVKERTPVAVVRTDSRNALIDANGELMKIPDGAKYPFPVLTGFSDADPISTRLARIRIYLALIRELDADDKGYSQEFSEVDVTNPEDIRVVTRNNDSVHLSNKKFLDQYKMFLALLPQCRTKRGTANVDIDLRFKGQGALCNLVGALAETGGSGTSGSGTNSAQSSQVPPEQPTAPAIEKHPKPAAKPGKASTPRGKKH